MNQEEVQKVLSNLELEEGSYIIEDPNISHTYLVYEGISAHFDDEGEFVEPSAICVGSLEEYRIDEFLKGEIEDLYSDLK